MTTVQKLGVFQDSLLDRQIEELVRYARQTYAATGGLSIEQPSSFSSLTATGILGGVKLDFGFTAYNGHLYTEIWRHTANDFSAASRVGATGARTYSDFISGAGLTDVYYYWVRNVNLNYDEGDEYGPVTGSISSDPQWIDTILLEQLGFGHFQDGTWPVRSEATLPDLSTTPDNYPVGSMIYLTSNGKLYINDNWVWVEFISDQIETADIISNISGQITETELYQDLNDRIDLIDTPTTGLVAITSGIQDSIATINSTLADLQNIPAYDSGTTYAVDDMVTYGGSLYRCILSSTGNLPTNATYWELVGEYSSLSEAVAAHAVTLSDHETRITDNEGDITANASDITALETGLTTANGNITTNASAISSLDTRVTSAEGTISSHSTSITSLQTDLTSAEGDISTNTGAISALDTRVTDNEGDISSNASDITTLQSGLSTANGNITTNAGAISALDTRVTTAEGTISSHSTSITSLQSDMSSAEGDITANAGAISALDTRVTDNEGNISSQASSISTLTSSVSTNTSAISTEATTRANADSAMASDISTLQTTVAGHTTSLSTKAEVSDLNAVYEIKTDVNGRVSGFGLVSTETESVFGIHADMFYIVDPVTDSEVIPFSVVDGVVYMDTAVIRDATLNGTKIVDGSISSDQMAANSIIAGKIAAGALVVDDGVMQNGYIKTALIQDAAITDAKIDRATVNKLVVTSADIQDAAITTAKIDDASITTAKIDDAAITTAKINDLAVDTLQLAGNAVNQPLLVEWTNNYSNTSITDDVWYTAYETSSINLHGGYNLFTGNFSFRVQHNSIGNVTVYLRVLHGTTEIFSESISSTSAAFGYASYGDIVAYGDSFDLKDFSPWCYYQAPTDAQTIKVQVKAVCQYGTQNITYVSGSADSWLLVTGAKK